MNPVYLKIPSFEAVEMPPLFRPLVVSNSRRYFGIRGCMKSGTNWAGNLLNLHPAISCTGEYHWERIVVPFEDNMAQRPMLKRHNAGERLKNRMDRLIRETMLDLANPKAKWVGDRTPGEIEPCFLPDASYISMLRDGRDVLVSRAFHMLSRPERGNMFRKDPIMAGLLPRFEKNPGYFLENPEQLLSSKKFIIDTANMWVRIVRSTLDTIQKHPEIPVLLVRYESLHADTDRVRREMYEFLDCDPDLGKPLDEKTEPNFAQENPTSLYRQGKVGGHRQYWNERVDEIFGEVANALLIELGYKV